MFCGPVRVPAHASHGFANVKLSMPDWPEGNVTPGVINGLIIGDSVDTPGLATALKTATPVAARDIIDGIGRVGPRDLANARFAIVADWPANFHKGGGKARLYIDSSTSAEQQAEIKGIFVGNKDGPIPALWSAVIDEWLPHTVADVSIDWDQKKIAVSAHTLSLPCYKYPVIHPDNILYLHISHILNHNSYIFIFIVGILFAQLLFE